MARPAVRTFAFLVSVADSALFLGLFLRARSSLEQRDRIRRQFEANASLSDVGVIEKTISDGEGRATASPEGSWRERADVRLQKHRPSRGAVDGSSPGGLDLSSPALRTRVCRPPPFVSEAPFVSVSNLSSCRAVSPKPVR